MGNIIVVVVLVIIIILAVKGSTKHFRGEGGCCGGSCSDCAPKTEKKKLTGNKIAEKIIHIEGMHCENCKNSVERQINKIDGAVANVNLKKNIAVVSLDREVPDEVLKKAVEQVDFAVSSIEDKEV
ncbi:MAG: heavy metal-associated domain-containing protein [Hespellia sp.]|nr:heavy metal-associated domain-containing protein [Hespellia sp.]